MEKETKNEVCIKDEKHLKNEKREMINKTWLVVSGIWAYNHLVQDADGCAEIKTRISNTDFLGRHRHLKNLQNKISHFYRPERRKRHKERNANIENNRKKMVETEKKGKERK